MHGQTPCLLRVLECQGQMREPSFLNHRPQIVGRRNPALRAFDGNLPAGNRAHEDFIARVGNAVVRESAKLYGVQGIPANCLAKGGSGEIVGTHLRQRKLDEKLAELYGE